MAQAQEVVSVLGHYRCFETLVGAVHIPTTQDIHSHSPACYHHQQLHVSPVEHRCVDRRAPESGSSARAVVAIAWFQQTPGSSGPARCSTPAVYRTVSAGILKT